MYLEHFGMRVNPFGISPRLDFLYKSRAFEEGMSHLVYGLENNEAIVMITGAIGTGKTMAVQSFMSRLGDRYRSALITNTSVDGRELLKLILDDLDCPLPSQADKSDLLIAFKQYLIAAGKQDQRIIVVIDEAQNLSRAVLEEVRLLTNLGQGEEQPVQIILVGQPELEAAVNGPDLEQLRQRIRVHCRLAPLTRDELSEYVDHRVQVAGGKPGVFGRPVLDAIYQRSGGVPRIVNTLCEQALLAAYVAGRNHVQPADLDNDEAGSRQTEPPAADVAVSGSGASSPTYAVPERMAERRSAKPPERQSRRRSERNPGPKSHRGAAYLTAAAIMVSILLIGWKWQELRALVPGSGGVGPTGSENVPAEPIAPISSPLLDIDTAIPNAATTESDSTANVEPLRSRDMHVARADSNGPPESRAPEAREPAAVVKDVESVGTPNAAVVPSDDACYLHVSSFRTASHAENVAADFVAAGQGAVVREQMVRDVNWYRVYLGPFNGHDEAVRRAAELREAGKITYYKVIRLGVGGEL